MYSTELTVRGNVVDEPRVHITDSGHMVVNFRLASTERRLVRETNGWVDGNRLFLTVTCWRSLAENVADRVHKGQPVIVHGRLYSREYERDGQNRLEYKLDADSVGHDLSRGQSKFAKAPAAGARSVELDAAGMPVLRDEPNVIAVDRGAGARVLVAS
ncbi:MAG: single-stranded DNA-binding protein [Frankiaceae bacterium]|nr:single-stranded DNA-binding protein [Frankiaceae bacterium]